MLVVSLPLRAFSAEVYARVPFVVAAALVGAVALELLRFLLYKMAQRGVRALERLAEATTYEGYLRAQGLAVDTEVNLQLGEYTLKNHQLQPLDPAIAAQPDFVRVFGPNERANPILEKRNPVKAQRTASQRLGDGRL